MRFRFSVRQSIIIQRQCVPVPGLILRLERQDSGLRWIAAWALEAIGPKVSAAKKALSSASQSEDQVLMGAAFEALERIGQYEPNRND